jgi:sensor domain CHASE-containing protein/signal transduction histidine kinase
MTLRTRTLVTIALTLSGLLGALYVLTRSQMDRGFSTVNKQLAESYSLVENRDVHKNIERALDALQATINNISTKLADWAQWDDTYRYVEDLNKEYQKSNLTSQTLAAIKLNFLAIVNKRGHIVFSESLDLVDGKRTALPPDLLGHLNKNAKLLSHSSPSDLVQGILLLHQGPMMVASRPIVTSQGLGPIRGAVIFGQFLNDSAVKQLGNLTHLTLDMRRLDDNTLPVDFVQARKDLSITDPHLIQRRSHNTVTGFAYVNDIYGSPSLILRISLPREIHRQELLTLQAVDVIGKNMMATQMIGVMAAGICLGAAILLILEILVLSRLGRLSSSTVTIGARKDFSARVVVEGKDELSRLGATINGMLMSLGETHEEIRNRTSELRLLMDSVPVALLSLNTDLRINPEYSRTATTMLGREELSGLDFCDCLGLHAEGAHAKLRAQLLDFLDLFRNEALREKDMGKLNPLPVHQLVKTDSVRWVTLDFHLIRRAQAQGNHVLVIIEDCTAEKELEQEVLTTQQENLQLKAIAEDPDLFREFIAEARDILDSVRAISESLTVRDTNVESLREIFRGVHTIKGVAGAFSLGRVTEIAGKLENSLALLLKKDVISAGTIERVHSEISALGNELDSIRASTMRILGTHLDDEAGLSVRVALGEFKDHIETIRTMHRNLSTVNAEAAKATDDIIRRLESMKMVPATKALGRATKIVPDLIRRLDKNAVFAFEGQDTRIDFEIARELNTPLVHLFRNAFDHGIEFPEDRLLANKPEQGRVTLVVHKENSAIVLEVSDDGVGIDLDKIKAAAVSKRLIDPDSASKLTPAECYDFLFRPGFSTKNDITEFSGRGVGLDVVHDFVKNKLKGSIHIESRPGSGTRFILRVPLRPDGETPESPPKIL